MARPSVAQIYPNAVLWGWPPACWFTLAIAGIVALSVAAVYRRRIRQITAMLGARGDERLAERMRAARELHETLLQTVHGSKMLVDHALRDRADRDRLVSALEQLSAWLGQAAAEGQAGLQALRVPAGETNDLAEAFRRALHECCLDSNLSPDVEMPLILEGAARELDPVVRDEIYRIGYEAIRNACVHSGAKRISVTLEYGDDLTLRVGDTGIGIDAAVVEHGRHGHFGLRGMRERAERIGGELTVNSAAGTGTAITLIVPGRAAFRPA